jgi:hypothetical protein
MGFLVREMALGVLQKSRNARDLHAESYPLYGRGFSCGLPYPVGKDIRYWSRRRIKRRLQTTHSRQ